MALSIKNREYEQVSRELAEITGKSITESGLEGLKRELERQKSIRKFAMRTDKEEFLTLVRNIQQRYAALPSKTNMTDDEILGYDESGIPTE
ncbi:MAG: type II toxin-antitoxin system VapB family antitoxin [Rhizobiales bacterium]|nr:type II toxin-antitoxin system VapB family antitoxin [Hyphomicrobiales bacterium]